MVLDPTIIFHISLYGMLFLCSQYFLFQFPTLTRSCIDGMIASAICTPIGIVTIVNAVVRILLTTFATYLSASTIILVMAIFLTTVATQWIGYELLNSLHCVADFYLLQYFGLVKCHYVGVNFNEFTFLHLVSSFLFLFLQLCIMTIPYFLQPLYLYSRICEGKFLHL